MTFQNTNLVARDDPVDSRFDIANGGSVVKNSHNVLYKSTIILAGGERLILTVHPARLILPAGQEPCLLGLCVLREAGDATGVNQLKWTITNHPQSLARVRCQDQ